MALSTSPTRRRTLFAVAGTLLASLTMLAFAACGTASTPTTQNQAPPLPDAATVLQQAEAATFKDVTFTITVTQTVNGQAVNGTGTGEMTKSPQRAQVTTTVPVTVNGKTYQKTVEQVTDFATKTVYTKTSGIPGASGKWTKTTIAKAPSNPVDISGIADLSTFKNATTVGADTVDGVAVWHLQSTQSNSTSSSSSSTGTSGTASTPGTTGASSTATTSTSTATATTSDLFIRQDNHFPAKLTMHETSGTTPTDVTFDFTKYDSGLTIAIPKV